MGHKGLSKPLGSRGIAQLVEHRSPKPRVEGSSPSAPAISSEHVDVEGAKIILGLATANL